MRWPTIRVGDVVQQIERSTLVEPDFGYSLLGMRSQLGGPFFREMKNGNEISASSLNQVKAGDFIYGRLSAWQGSFGIIPEALDNCYVSNEFPIFSIDETRFSPRFLVLWFGLPETQRTVKAECFGSGRTRYKEKYFLQNPVPSPPLDEQRRIVAKVETLAARIDEVKLLRQEIRTDAQAMLHGAFQKLIERAEYHPMAEVAPIVRRKVEVDLDGEYPELGVRSFGKGIFQKPTLVGAELDWQKLYRIQEGDLVISNIKAWEGAIAVASRSDHGRVGSHRYITCVPKKGIVTANFLCFYLLTKDGLEKVQEASPGSADRNRTLAMKRLEKIKVPVPDYDKQLWFDNLQVKAASINQAQSGNQTELDALLPAVLDKAFRGEL